MKPISILLVGMIFCGYISHAQNGLTSEEARAVLEHHNKVRRDVGSPPLQWSDRLSAFAQRWAEKLAKDGCDMEHRPRTGEWAQQYGENIFWGSADSYTPLDASESWYEEIADYRYGVLDYNNWYKTGHYTQMVWNTTTKMGMGKAYCAGGEVIIVANYDPPGNMMGRKPY